MKIYTFTLQGKPPAQKQTRFARGHAYDPSKKDSNYIKMQLAEQMKEKSYEMILGPVAIFSIFWFIPPASTSNKNKQKMLENKILHFKRPDTSNLYYILENAMKGIVIRDDSQICAIDVFKRYGDDNCTFLELVALGEQTY